MEPPGGSEESQAMKEWIKSVQKWIEDSGSALDRKPSEDSAQDMEGDSYLYAHVA